VSGPFAGSGEFKPTTGDKNAREQLIEFAERYGWMLDLTAIRSRQTSPRPHDPTEEQDPNRFIRQAEHGGLWHALLDYEVRGDPDEWKPMRKWDNTLRGLSIWHSSWVDDKGVIHRMFTLNNYVQTNTSRSLLWDITDSEDGTFKPLVKRAREVLQHPDMAAWLVMQTKNSEAEQARRQHEEHIERQRQRRKPLPLTVTADEFRRRAMDLRRTAGEIGQADGLTDIHAVVAIAEKQIELLRMALVPLAEDCFYCGQWIEPEDRKVDPNNHQTYGACCEEHALRYEKKVESV